MTAGADEVHRPRTVLVTGGGGFLGRAIVERLVARGDRVRSFSRKRYGDLDALGVETIAGDLANASSVSAACAGCDVVFHVAARAGVWGSYADYYDPNVRGTAHCLEACRRHGVKRLVFTSSPSVVFDGGDMEGVDESVPYPRRYRSHYSATKALAERQVLAANSDALKTVALRPHLIWGPRDSHIVPRIVSQGRAGKLRLIGTGDNKVDTTYIDNAADAHVLAAEALERNPEVAGRAYFVSNGEPVAIREIINGILMAAGLEPVTKRVPRTLAKVVGGMLEIAHALLRLPGEPRMTRFVADELACSHWFDITAARRELGYAPQVSLNEGLQRLEEWFRRNRSR